MDLAVGPQRRTTRLPPPRSCGYSIAMITMTRALTAVLFLSASAPSFAKPCTTATSDYTGSIPDDQLKKQLVARPVIYLLGGLDTLPLAGFDSSCSAMAQGPNRLARGQAFASYVSKKYGAPHKVVVIPLCGHNGRCMYTAADALKLLFPKPL